MPRRMPADFFINPGFMCPFNKPVVVIVLATGKYRLTRYSKKYYKKE
jgi:hypothetical protein